MTTQLPSVQQKAPTCTWTKDPDWEMGDTWNSGCGEAWSFIDGGPAYNRVTYCHNCGKRVAISAKVDTTVPATAPSSPRCDL